MKSGLASAVFAVQALGYSSVGAGMLIVAGGGHGLPLDYDELERWTRIGFERGMAMRRGER